MEDINRLTVVLRCDPVRPETHVSIDGRAVDGGDIYGFLYPVRRCVLQAWLGESGSWPGLRRQLEELSRGGELELRFLGRRCDYEDLRAALEGMEGLTLSFSPWSPENDYRRAADALEKKLLGLLEDRVVLDMSYYGMDFAPSHSFAQLFPERAERIRELLRSAADENWVSDAATPARLRQLRSGSGCVRVYEGAIGSMEGTGALRALTSSMQRPAEMVMCVLDTPEKCAEYSCYAAQFPGPRPLFTDSGHSDFPREIVEKYVSPLLLRRRLEALGAACAQLSDARDEKPALEARLEALTGHISKKSESDELNRCRMRLRWLAQRAGKLRALLDEERALSSMDGGDIDG